MSDVREPQKATSIEKKNKIIEAGLKAFKEIGYYKTNTAEIAKIAGVSTGIVYQYFKDKKDILIYAVNKYFETLFIPLELELKKLKAPINLENSLRNFIYVSLKSHEKNSIAHEEMVGLSHLDDDVSQIFIKNEYIILEKIIYYLESNGIKTSNMKEKTHIAYNLVESLCHEGVYHKHEDMDFDSMINETIKIILELFSK